MNITYHVHTVDIVYVSVFPSTVMNAVFMHRDFRTIKHRRFVHVIPCVEVWR